MGRAKERKVRHRLEYVISSGNFLVACFVEREGLRRTIIPVSTLAAEFSSRAPEAVARRIDDRRRMEVEFFTGKRVPLYISWPPVFQASREKFHWISIWRMRDADIVSLLENVHVPRKMESSLFDEAKRL